MLIGKSSRHELALHEATFIFLSFLFRSIIKPSLNIKEESTLNIKVKRYDIVIDIPRSILLRKYVERGEKGRDRYMHGATVV